MKKLKWYLFVLISTTVIIALIFLCANLQDKEQAQEKAERKQAMIAQEEEDKIEKKIQQKQLKVAAQYLKLPEEKVMMQDSYDIDFGNYEEGETYRLIAEGIEYEVSFNQTITKVDKFVQMPSDESEYCSDSSTDRDSDSTHFPKIKRSSSKRK